jgi:hypothetical protein
MTADPGRKIDEPKTPYVRYDAENDILLDGKLCRVKLLYKSASIDHIQMYPVSTFGAIALRRLRPLVVKVRAGELAFRTLGFMSTDWNTSLEVTSSWSHSKITLLRTRLGTRVSGEIKVAYGCDALYTQQELS